MAIPKYDEFFSPFIFCLRDGKVHSLKEIRAVCAETYALSEEDMQETTASGVLLFHDRVGWARTYLKKAGLIESPSRSNFQLTPAGIQAVQDGVEKLDLEYLKRYESFRRFYRPGKKEEAVEAVTRTVTEDIKSPQESISDALHTLHATLADDLMAEVMKLSSYEFEALVLKLLVKMGYGSDMNGKAIVTKKSGDEGIDGIVTADRFGFDAVYIQAKQWKDDSVVGRPEIQKFLGALAGQGATKGIYMTTAHFSKEAQLFAEKQLHSKIVLVDGARLMDLMIEYNLGVSVIGTYQIKRIDYDFFNEDM